MSINAAEIYPRRIPGYHGECRCGAGQIAFLLRHLPEDGALLEVGTADGVTSAVIADARPRARIVSVDTFEEIRISPSRRALVGVGDIARNRAERWLVNSRLNQRPNQALWVGSLESLATWLRPAELFDVAFIDADHTYACTLGCLESAAPLVRPGGKLIVHDYGDPKWPEVAPAAEDFAAGHGWRVVDGGTYIVAMARLAPA